MELCKNYFDILINEKNEENLSEEGLGASIRSGSQEYKFHGRAQKIEVANALRMMKRGKSLGPENLPIETGKSLSDIRVPWLTKLFNKIILTKKMFDEWRKSIFTYIEE